MLCCTWCVFIFGLFIPIDPLVLVGGHCTRWRSCWNLWLPYWLRRLWWSRLLLSKQLLVQAVYLLQFNLGLCVHVLILIRAHLCVWKLGSVPGWLTSFPFVSPFSNHSTDTILLFVSTPLTAAPWTRPEVCRKKTKFQCFEFSNFTDRRSSLCWRRGLFWERWGPFSLPGPSLAKLISTNTLAHLAGFFPHYAHVMINFSNDPRFVPIAHAQTGTPAAGQAGHVLDSAHHNCSDIFCGHLSGRKHGTSWREGTKISVLYEKMATYLFNSPKNCLSMLNDM